MSFISPKTAAAWLPRSLTQILDYQDERGNYLFEIPYWLATEKFVP